MGEVVADVHYSYHFFRLGEVGRVEADLPDLFTPSNGLVSVWPGGAIVMTGAKVGNARVTFDVGDGPEPPAGEDAWDETAEVVYESPTGEVRVVEMWSTPESPTRVGLPHGPGRYRMRVDARDRETARDVAGADHVEEFRISFRWLGAH